MPIPIPDLASLDADAVQVAIDYTAQRVVEQVPSADVRRGVIGDVVCNLGSILSQAQASVIEEKVFKGSDLSLFIADPSQFSNDEADLLLGRFRVFRRSGETAAGSIIIATSQRVPVTIPKGLVFLANGLQFTANEAYAVRISVESVTGSNDRLLYANSDGTFAFSIDVTAVSVGSSGRLKRNARLTPQDLIPNFLKAYAESDFDSGADEESNSEMAARLAQGLAERSPSNRITMEAMVMAETTFQGAKASSIIGFGDPEQARYHTLFPVAHGSRIDYYCQTSTTTLTTTLQKSCTLVEAAGTVGIWAFSLGMDEFPGAYRAGRIVAYADRLLDKTGYEILETSPGFALPDNYPTTLPDITKTEEAAFSPFQTLTIKFLDTDTLISGMTVGSDTRDYAVDVEGFPLLKELQAFLADRKRCSPSADILAKAPVPCFVSVSCVISVKSGQPLPDVSAIKAEIVSYISSRGFAGKLGSSAIAYVIGRFLTSDHTLGSVDLVGEILKPDRTKVTLRSDEMLIIPNLPSIMTTPNTVAFVVSSGDINISIR